MLVPPTLSQEDLLHHTEIITLLIGLPATMKGSSREELLGSSQEALRHSAHDLRTVMERALTAQEKSYLLHAERGDVPSVKSLLEQYEGQPDVLDVDCVDPLNRSALIAAIENENMDLIKVLLGSGIRVKDALLHAIKEDYVEAVELLLQWEEDNHIEGEPYSWESVESAAATFTPDITPLILAAHRNHYEILKILLDRGATLPTPHDVKCGCDECMSSSKTDSLRHSQARINAYRALTAPSLIALSSADPLLSAFQLSWELRNLSRAESEFVSEYKALRQQCQEFATTLLDHTRTSKELETILNYNPAELDCWEPGERQTLGRLKLAIKYKQKAFVAHPNVQQLLGAIWYEGLPGFRRKNMMGQMIQVAKLGMMYPVYSTLYMLAPNSESGRFMKKPFVKFICHSSSYMLFLMLLSLASQRAEYVALEWIGQLWMQGALKEYLQLMNASWKEHERGAFPGVLESAVAIFVSSLIWREIRALWADGLEEYISDLWNIVDFITNAFYLTWLGLRISSWYIVQRDHKMGLDPWYPREEWDPYDPMLLSEGAFAAGMIFSFLKLVHIFSINPYLGPLQVSLGRMILDIIKFFFVYMLVLFAFACGLNQLMWYYADLEKNKCYHNNPLGVPDFDTQEKACSIWRRYANLFETSQSLFWASFGLVDLMTFDLTGIKSFTRFWALLTFGSYSVINIIVLLNMLIAMMSNSYQIISERSDMEWKFARSNLWISYFDDGDTVPPPFNLIPTPKHVATFLHNCCSSAERGSIINKSRERAREEHEAVVRVLVRRYVTAEQRARDDVGVTEDDVMEIRQDISTLRFELIDILRNNGMKTPRVQQQDATVAGKKGRTMERRLLKDFQIGIVEGIINDVISRESKPKDVFSQIAKAIGNRQESKRDWNEMVRSNTTKRDPIGTTLEFKARRNRQSLRAHILDNVAAKTIDQDKLLAYNPQLSSVTPTTRVAYAKFMRSKLKSDFVEKEKLSGSRTSLGERFQLVDEVKSPKKGQEEGSQEDREEVGANLDVRTTIEEVPDEEGVSRKFEIQADVEKQGESDEVEESDQTPHSPKSADPFNSIDQAGLPPPMPKYEAPASKDHIVQIEPDTEEAGPISSPESEDKTTIPHPQATVGDLPSEDTKLAKTQDTPDADSDRRKSRMSKASVTSEKSLKSLQPPKADEDTSGGQKDPKERSPGPASPGRSAKVSPMPSPAYVNPTKERGKSKATGKTVSGWI